MSSVYNLEPPTKGKVVIHTTHGPLDVELWPKEAPKATRNFLHLSLLGYYDANIFHRVIKSFLVQAGDPTGTGTGGTSVYGAPFADEFHSRLRFNHRGLLASANAGTPNSNASQFFFTLDRCDWLDKKNTIFGKVTGDSIFNLLHLGDVETDKNDRPLDPVPKILSVEVLWNPFDDIIVRDLSHTTSLASQDAEPIQKKKAEKTVKKLNLLSFGEEAEEEEKELSVMKEKIKSSHDVLDDPRLLKNESFEEQPNLSEIMSKKDLQTSVREALTSKKGVVEKDLAAKHYDMPDVSDDDEADFDARMRSQILQKRKEHGELPDGRKLSVYKTIPESQINSHPLRSEDSEVQRVSKLEKLAMKKKGVGSEVRAERIAKADVESLLLNETEQERHRNKLKKRRLQGREEETLAKLEKFKAPSSFEAIAEAANEDDSYGWRKSELKFLVDLSVKDNMARTNDANEYVVHDPLFENGKEKFNKAQAKLKRREREWAGKSLT